MDIRKLQRAIVDGLEDVKAQNIVVFNTEHLSPLFERVIIASGTSNRQTKALASSVRVAVKSSGQQVLRCEGEDNGEWIIVDCGAAVAHIMQPAIRDYYRLEEIWGGKVVKMKLGEGKGGLVKASEEDQDAPPAKKAATKTPAKTPAKKAAPRKVATASSGAGKAALAGAKPAKRSAEKAPAAKKSSAPRKVTVGSAASAKPAAARKTAGGKAPVKTTTGAKAPAKKAAIKTIVVKPPMKKATAKKSAAAPKRGR